MMKIDLIIALLTLRAGEPEQLGNPYSKNGLPTLQKETHVKHRAGVLLAQRGPRLCPRATSLFNAVTAELRGEKAVLLRRASKTIKFTSHTSDVSWVTDRSFDTLLMCSYSASSICELATSSSSGEVQLGSRPALAELIFLEETPDSKNCMSAQIGSQQRAPSRPGNKFFWQYPVQQAQRPDSQSTI